MTIEGGVRWVLWPPWYSTTNNIANFDPKFYDPAPGAIVNPANGALTGGNRYNGIVLPGDGFEGDGGDGLPSTRQRALPRPAARLLGHALQRVRAAARRRVSAEREDDPPPQRRHLPLPRDAERLDAARRQPAVPAAGHRLQRPGGQPGRRHRQRIVAASASTARISCSSTRRRTCGASASSARSRSASRST